jgi:hypothetical protein
MSSGVAARVVLAWLALFGCSSAWPSRVQAFCRTSTCSDCPRDPETGCTIGGVPIQWPEACLSFSVNHAASSAIGYGAATALVGEAFATWENARCDDAGGTPSIHVSNAFGPAICAEPEYSPASGNANLIVFRDTSWPYTGSVHELAVTTVTHDQFGVIYDADMEINATSPLSVTVAGLRQKGLVVGQHDLLSILTHEAGHFLGLDHSLDDAAIMRAALPSGEVRTELGADDVAAICTLYPPERETAACNPTPHGGFSPACVLGSELIGSCSTAGVGRARGARNHGSFAWLAPFAWLACALALSSLRARAGRRCRRAR